MYFRLTFKCQPALCVTGCPNTSHNLKCYFFSFKSRKFCRMCAKCHSSAVKPDRNPLPSPLLPFSWISTFSLGSYLRLRAVGRSGEEALGTKTTQLMSPCNNKTNPEDRQWASECSPPNMIDEWAFYGACDSLKSVSGTLW